MELAWDFVQLGRWSNRGPAGCTRTWAADLPRAAPGPKPRGWCEHLHRGPQGPTSQQRGWLSSCRGQAVAMHSGTPVPGCARPWEEWSLPSTSGEGWRGSRPCSILRLCCGSLPFPLSPSWHVLPHPTQRPWPGDPKACIIAGTTRPSPFCSLLGFNVSPKKWLQVLAPPWPGSPICS